MKKIFFCVFFVIIFSFSVFGVGIENDFFKIDCTPEESLLQSVGFVDYCSYNWKANSSITRDVVYCFESELVSGKVEYWNNNAWLDVTSLFSYRFFNISRGYCYYIQNVNWVGNETKVIKLTYRPSNIFRPKWDTYFGNITSLSVDLKLDPFFSLSSYEIGTSRAINYYWKTSTTNLSNNETNIDLLNYSSIDYLFNNYVTTSRSNRPFVQLVNASISDLSVFNINGCNVSNISGIYTLRCEGESWQVQRARIYKTLFYGSTGLDSRLNNYYVTGITALRTNVYEDVGLKFYFMNTSSFGQAVDGSFASVGLLLNFSSVINNTVSSWSRERIEYTSDIGSDSARIAGWQIPSGTTINFVTYPGYHIGQTSYEIDEIGSDTSGDNIDNPASGYIYSSSGSTNHNYYFYAYSWVLLASKKNITYTQANSTSGSGTVFYGFKDFESLGYPKLSYVNDSVKNFSLQSKEVDLLTNVQSFSVAASYSGNISLDISFDGNLSNSIYLTTNNLSSPSNVYVLSTNISGNNKLKYVIYLNNNATTLNNLSINLEVYTVGQAIFSNCSGSSNYAINFSVYNEDLPTKIEVSSLEINSEYWSNGLENFKQNYSFYLTGESNYYLCTNWTNINSNLYVRYSTPGGFTHRFYLNNRSYSVETKLNIELFNANTTSGYSDLRLTVRDLSFSPIEGVVVSLLRNYPSSGFDNYKVVQMDQSDYYGQTHFDILENTVDYRLVFSDVNNNVLKTINPIKFFCTGGLCDVTVSLDPSHVESANNGVVANYIYDNNTRVVTTSWSSTLSSVVLFTASQYLNSTLLVFCNTSQSGVSGVINCDLSNVAGNVFISLTGNGVSVFGDWIVVSNPGLRGLVSNKDQSFFSFLILVVCFGFGLFSPVALLLAMVFGFLALYFLQLLNPLTIAGLIVIICISGLIGLKVRR